MAKKIKNSTRGTIFASIILLRLGTYLDAPRVTQKEYDRMDKVRLEMGSVPVRIAAHVYGRDPAWVRAGIIAGWLPIGEATRNGKRVTDVQQMNSKFGRINYYISPKLLYEQTGYEWRGER
mgnify:CR=1 FL=1